MQLFHKKERNWVYLFEIQFNYILCDFSKELLLEEKGQLGLSEIQFELYFDFPKATAVFCLRN